ncbi:SEC-C motif-containing protein [Salinimicrobium sediminis]|uniref:SEC-C motif-containing protein n=1 Tax=Salinimicrobium sediminis TaxID=1343891 RepID=A0A285X8C8_9FLAO|nr:SEC-C metal-binding domain-containing protein [Salinimicrobium sediminis]SOC81572.1 SEC-C motif-containing protein [Salinimicrobium sediminis]
MNSILIDNLNYRWRKKGNTYHFGSDWSNSGIPFNSDERGFFINPFIKSLLLFDKIYIKTQHLEEFIFLFGIKDAHKLFITDNIVLIDDGGTRTAFLPHNDDYLLMNLSDVSKSQLDSIQERLLDYYKGSADRHLVKPLIFKAEKVKVDIDGDWIGHQCQEEVCLDLNNKNVTKYLNFRNSYDNVIVKPDDIVPLMRLQFANKSLFYQNELGIQNLSTEASIQHLINIKLNPVLTGKKGEALELFSKIIQDKQLPDLTRLYTNNIIDIDLIISLKNDISGKKFRAWFEDSDYDEKSVYKQLMSKSKNLSDYTVTRLIRWGVPNLIGIIEPISGAIASTIDSFVVDKIMKGWHPNFFLDDVLTKKIDQATREQRSLEEGKALEKKFGKIGRNDPCPCKSGKKYKKCCMTK